MNNSALKNKKYSDENIRQCKKIITLAKDIASMGYGYVRFIPCEEDCHQKNSQVKG